MFLGKPNNIFVVPFNTKLMMIMKNYLGVPFFLKRFSKKSLQSTLDKMINKLSNWKVKTLSFAGRLTSVLLAVLSYVI